MTRRNICLLPLLILAGIVLPAAVAYAQDKDKPHPFRNVPPQERRQAIQKLRQERAQNPERNQSPGRVQNPEGAQQSRPAEKPRPGGAIHDGALSREEAAKTMPRFSRHFDEADTNRDGVVTREELRAFRERRRQQRMDRGNGDPRD